MSRHVDYYLTLVSPWAYMGGVRLSAIAQATGATVAVKPVRFGPVLETTGGLPLSKRSPERRAYRLAELDRWSRHLGIPLTLEPAYFPADETRAAAAVIAAGLQGLDTLALANRIGKLIWEDERNIADEATLADAIADVGMNAEAVLAAASAPEIAGIWQANTDEALTSGMFGAPWYVVNGETFWGQDRLDFVQRALERQA